MHAFCLCQLHSFIFVFVLFLLRYLSSRYTIFSEQISICQGIMCLSQKYSNVLETSSRSGKGLFAQIVAFAFFR